MRRQIERTRSIAVLYKRTRSIAVLYKRRILSACARSGRVYLFWHAGREEQIEPPHSAAAAFPPSAVRRCKVPRGWLGLCQSSCCNARPWQQSSKTSIVVRNRPTPVVDRVEGPMPERASGEHSALASEHWDCQVTWRNSMQLEITRDTGTHVGRPPHQSVKSMAT